MYGLTIFLCSALLISSTLAATDCSKPPSEVNPRKIRQCCNGPPLENIMKETYADVCKDVLKALPSQMPPKPSSTIPPTSSSSSPPSEGPQKGPPKGGSPPPGKKAFMCSSECMLNQTQIFNNGQFNKANANKFINEVIKDEDFTSILEKAVEKCATKTADKLKAGKAGNMECSPFSGSFIHCLNQEADINCPESRWLQSTNCNNVRKFIKSCGVPNFDNVNGPPPNN